MSYLDQLLAEFPENTPLKQLPKLPKAPYGSFGSTKGGSVSEKKELDVVTATPEGQTEKSPTDDTAKTARSPYDSYDSRVSRPFSENRDPEWGSGPPEAIPENTPTHGAAKTARSPDRAPGEIASEWLWRLYVQGLLPSDQRACAWCCHRRGEVCGIDGLAPFQHLQRCKEFDTALEGNVLVERALKLHFPDEIVLEHAHPTERPDLLDHPESLQAFRKALWESGRIFEESQHPPFRAEPAKPEAVAPAAADNPGVEPNPVEAQNPAARLVSCRACRHCKRPTIGCQSAWCRICGKHNAELIARPMAATVDEHGCDYFEPMQLTASASASGPF